jgi:predicted MFS family arabinose efflux permease
MECVEKCRLVAFLHNADDAESATEAGHLYSGLFLPSLVISYFATSPIGIVTGLFLLKMAETFGVDKGFMGQINTFSSIVSVVFALLMGVLSVRLRHKSLLLIGLLFLGVSAVGCYFAWDINSIFILYSLSGVGIAMVGPMAIALVGENLAFKKRANAVGWVVAGGSLAYLIGAPIMGVLAGFGGWRISILGFVIPFSILSLLLAFAGVPSQSSNRISSVDGDSYLESLKEIVSNRSAVGCLVGNVFRNAAFMAVLLYGTSFFIERFSLSEGVASFVILGAALFYTLGSVVAGSMVNRYGRKFSTVSTALLAGLFTISYAYVPSLLPSLALNFTAAWFMGMMASAASSLTLEQVPRFRGSMMSISSAATSLGSAVGAAVGGMALIWYDYDVLGAILGGMGIIAAMVFYLVTKDPTCEKI